MRSTLKSSTLVVLLALLGCGPSEEDTVAAARACRAGARFVDADFEATEPTFEQNRARAQFPLRMRGLASGLEHAKVANVIEVMRETCPEHLDAVKAGIEYHRAAGGEVFAGLGELIAGLE